MDRSDPEAACFDPEISSMISRMISGVVEGLVVLEIDLKDVAQEAQLVVGSDLVPTDGCSERAEAGVEPGPSQLCSDGLLSCCVSHLKCRLSPNLEMV